MSLSDFVVLLLLWWFNEVQVKEESRKRYFQWALHQEEENGEKNYLRNEFMFDIEETEEGLEGYDELEKSSLMSQKNTEKRFGQSLDFIASSFVEYGGLPEGTNTTPLIKESVHVISCGYKEKTKWGKEIGWIKDLWFIYRRYIDWVDGSQCTACQKDHHLKDQPQ